MRTIVKEVQRAYYYFLHLNSNDRKKFLRLFILCILLFSAWLIGYKWRDGRIYFQNAKIEKLKYKKNQLIDSIDALSDKLVEFHFILNDGDYYRYLAFKHGNVLIPKTANPHHLKLMTEQANINKIPLKYFYRLIWRESKYNPKALSNKGAKGYMQVIPSTLALFKKRYNKDISKLSEEEINIIIGSYMLGHLYKKYKRWDLTFAAYNAGSIVRSCNCVPNYTETQNYVRYIINKK